MRPHSYLCAILPGVVCFDTDNTDNKNPGAERRDLSLSKFFDRPVDGGILPPPLPLPADFAKILWISVRKICKEAIFSLARRLTYEKISYGRYVHAVAPD